MSMKKESKSYQLNEIQSYSKIMNYQFRLQDDKRYNSAANRLRHKYGISLASNRGLWSRKGEKGAQLNLDKFIRKHPKFKKDISKICEKYALDPNQFSDAVNWSVYYGVLRLNIRYQQGLVIYHDFKDNRKLIAVDRNYPVVLRISPYASKRDILDFIAKTYGETILPIQKRYKKKHVIIDKTRHKNFEIGIRNEFIRTNRALPRKALLRAVNDKFKRKIFNIDYLSKILRNN